MIQHRIINAFKMITLRREAFMQEIQHVAYELPQAILNWYDFKDNAKVLLIYNNSGALAELFAQKNVLLAIASVEELLAKDFINKFRGSFDYIIAVGVLERFPDHKELLACFKILSKDDAVLLLGTENRFGIRYFLGDADPFTGHVFDGIDNYRELTWEQRSHLDKRCYSKSEILDMLKACGWDKIKPYSVFPSLEAPQLIFADTYIPSEELANRYFPRYRSKDTIFAREENILTDLIDNGLFHRMADALLFECARNGVYNHANQVTISMDRGHAKAMVTIINDDATVIKKALFEGGKDRLAILAKNMLALKAAGVPTIEGTLIGDSYVMPHSEGILVNVYLQRLLRRDTTLFLKVMDDYKELLLQSSKLLWTDEKLGPVYAKGYLDMVPINCFWMEDKFCFFDQEFVADEYPVYAILYRAIATIYQGQPDLEVIYPIGNLLKRYDLWDKREELRKYTDEFIESLQSDTDMSEYNRKTFRNDEVLKKNRLRMDYSEEEFEQLFYNPFANLEDKKIYLFGAGRYAKKFIAMYRRDYEIEAVIDNDSGKWGTELEGYQIYSPQILYDLEPRKYKVIVCMKNYDSVLQQLRQMGIVNVSVFESNKVYPGRQACAVYKDSLAVSGIKKYKIGYIAGVFDLYHLGHLNMFRRAKEQCEYLIVGVVTDEGVRTFKQKEPFIPFDERIEMVRSCRYVDEVVEIPFIYRTTKEAFEKYHFDVQFSGSDYQNNPEWLETKKYLEEHGSAMVFFPYTEQTSSTKIKELIERGLI